MSSKRRIAAGGIAVVSAAFIVYGVLRGEAGIILNKAVNICLECIGLG
ncbi:MAG: thioredoxin [Lachnospiraceae bacterium]|nr:thioredoxin [Lachnospiraceae bacterium]